MKIFKIGADKGPPPHPRPTIPFKFSFELCSKFLWIPFPPLHHHLSLGPLYDHFKWCAILPLGHLFLTNSADLRLLSNTCLSSLPLKDQVEQRETIVIRGEILPVLIGLPGSEGWQFAKELSNFLANHEIGEKDTWPPTNWREGGMPNDLRGWTNRVLGFDKEGILRFAKNDQGERSEDFVVIERGVGRREKIVTLVREMELPFDMEMLRERVRNGTEGMVEAGLSYCDVLRSASGGLNGRIVNSLSAVHSTFSASWCCGLNYSKPRSPRGEFIIRQSLLKMLSKLR